MKLAPEQLKLLGLSRKEMRVLDALRAGKNTPVLIHEHTKVSRPAIYEILERLHKRGLVKSNIQNGKKYWSQAKDRDIEEALYETKKALFDFEEGREEVHGLSDATVVVHRGADAIRTLLEGLFKENRGKRLYGFQGDVVAIGWNNIMGVEGVNEINRLIKKNEIIVEAIIPLGWFERQIKIMGKQWAKDFKGRMSVTHEIDEVYFNHGGQIFLFKESLYLMAMNEELIIEVRNSDMQKLILSMFQFVQANSRKFDVNEKLRTLIEKAEGE